MAAEIPWDLNVSFNPNNFNAVSPDSETRVLQWVNSVRARCGIPPLDGLPRGIQADHTECVIARALKDIGYVRVGNSTLRLLDRSGTPAILDLPPIVRTFIAMFDGGWMSHLVDNQSVARQAQKEKEPGSQIVKKWFLPIDWKAKADQPFNWDDMVTSVKPQELACIT